MQTNLVSTLNQWLLERKKRRGVSIKNSASLIAHRRTAWPNMTFFSINAIHIHAVTFVMSISHLFRAYTVSECINV